MRSLFNALEKRRKFNAACRELRQMSDRELNDLGFSRADIPDVVSGRKRFDA